MNNINEKNKIIAEFMSKEIYQKHHKSNYHCSWNWLIPVVQKIEQDYEGVPQEIINISLYSDINEVYKAVVQFIKNQNN